MRPAIRDLVSIVQNTLPIREPIYEFGSLQVGRDSELADLRPIFPRQKYVGADMREGPGVDKLLDLHDIDLPSGSAGTVLCIDTLEHVEYPHKALEEIHRIIVPDGVVVITSVMDFPIHDYPYDYWRFTPEAFRSLLKPFPHSFIGFAGNEKHPHTVVGIGFKGVCPPLVEFKNRYKDWQEEQIVQASLPKQKSLPTITWIRRLITPPIFSNKGRKALGLTRRSSCQDKSESLG
ncbi:MAG: class I SAM-dependent methyltransferase [Proteobacteria bacterium]|nr:class I SAM-dependent methyltransferase [Pseudomonadota bacterium]